MSKEDIKELFNEQDIKDVNVITTLIDLIIELGVASSKREAREFINSGAISINGDKVTDSNMELTKDLFIDNTYIVVKRGKKNYYIGKC